MAVDRFLFFSKGLKVNGALLLFSPKDPGTPKRLAVKLNNSKLLSSGFSPAG